MHDNIHKNNKTGKVLGNANIVSFAVQEYERDDKKARILAITATDLHVMRCNDRNYDCRPRFSTTVDNSVGGKEESNAWMVIDKGTKDVAIVSSTELTKICNFQETMSRCLRGRINQRLFITSSSPGFTRPVYLGFRQSQS